LFIFFVVSLHDVLILIVLVGLVLETAPLGLEVLPLVLQAHGASADRLTDFLGPDILSQQLIYDLVFDVWWLHVQLVKAI
jgi:hypothetical protein